MTSDWKEYKLQDLNIQIIDGDRGKNYPHKEELFDSGYCLFLSAQNVTKNGFNFKECQWITKEKDEILRNGKLKYGDIVITTRGTVGNVVLYSNNIKYRNMRINSGMLIVRCNDSICNKFIYYILSSKVFSQKILSMHTGTAQPQLPKSHFQKIEIMFPSLETQQKIAKVLSALDDKIELNNRINENLEQQMDLFYKSIFDNDYNTIELGSVIETTSGGTPSRKNLDFYKNGKINWIKSKELSGTYVIETEEKITNEALIKSAAKILPKETVLLAMYGATVGAYGITSKEMTCNQAICGLIQNENYPYSYIFENIKLSNNTLKNMAVGSAQQNISQVLIRQLPVHLDLNKVQQYSAIANKFMHLVLNIQQENQYLIQLRDTLLPKLMSDEIDVNDVEINDTI